MTYFSLAHFSKIGWLRERILLNLVLVREVGLEPTALTCIRRIPSPLGYSRINCPCRIRTCELVGQNHLPLPLGERALLYKAVSCLHSSHTRSVIEFSYILFSVTRHLAIISTRLHLDNLVIIISLNRFARSRT